MKRKERNQKTWLRGWEDSKGNEAKNSKHWCPIVWGKLRKRKFKKEEERKKKYKELSDLRFEIESGISNNLLFTTKLKKICEWRRNKWIFPHSFSSLVLLPNTGRCAIMLPEMSLFIYLFFLKESLESKQFGERLQLWNVWNVCEWIST